MIGILLHTITLAALPIAPGSMKPPACATACAIAMCMATDHQAPNDVVQKLLHDGPAAAASMTSLRAMAQELGIPMTGFRSSVVELVARGQPAAVLLRDPDHFACVAGIDNSWVQMLDGWPLRLQVVTREEFEKRFTGLCLLADTPSPKRPAPRMVVARRHSDLGSAASGEDVDSDFVVSNTGNAPLTLDLKQSSCSCTSTGQRQIRVEAGGIGSVPVRIRVASSPGQLQFVRLSTNDPMRPVLYLSMRVRRIPQGIGWAPRTVALAGTGPLVCNIRLYGPVDLSVLAADCETDLFETRLVDRLVDAQKVVYTIELRTSADLHSGRHVSKLLIRTQKGNAETIAVPVTVIVPSIAQASPSRIALLDVKPGDFGATVAAEALTPDGIDVASAQVESVPLTATLTRVSASSWRIQLSGRLGAGYYRGRLLIHLKSQVQPQIEVPITLVVGGAGG